MPYNTKQIVCAYPPKTHNNKRENQVILFMITDGKKWHYLAAKSLSALLRGKTSNHNGDFYCLNCFHSYSAKSNLKKHAIIYADLECLLEKMHSCQNNLEKSYTEKKKVSIRLLVIQYLLV